MNNANQVTISGRITRDPEVRDVNQSKVAVIRLASNRSYKKGEEWVERATFVDVEAWNRHADLVATLKKGTEVMVLGLLESDDWEKDGEKRSKLKIRVNSIDVIATPRLSKQDASGGNGGAPSTPSQPAGAKYAKKPKAAPDEEYSLEIPF
jgi:single-strand DNA-binding protein